MDIVRFPDLAAAAVNFKILSHKIELSLFNVSMKRIIPILILFLLFQVSCKKEKTPDTSGTVTIDNTRSLSTTYYVYGFLFSEAKKVSTLENPPPDITVDTDGNNVLFQANNLKNSFYLFGEFNNASAAKTAFDNLITATVQEGDWEGLAYPVSENQIWIYRSGKEHYAKLRIISVIAEERSGQNYAECTFEWVYQPDGTLTFP